MTMRNDPVRLRNCYEKSIMPPHRLRCLLDSAGCSIGIQSNTEAVGDLKQDNSTYQTHCLPGCQPTEMTIAVAGCLTIQMSQREAGQLMRPAEVPS